MKLLTLACALAVFVVGAEQKAVVPANGPALAGPYSPGVIADGYLYVSGQGAKAADGQMPPTFEAQAQQTLENVKAVVEAAGLTLDHVVYTHVYLEDISNAAALDRVYARYFPKDPPARAMIGVARLPGSTCRDQRGRCRESGGADAGPAAGVGCQSAVFTRDAHEGSSVHLVVARSRRKRIDSFGSWSRSRCCTR